MKKLIGLFVALVMATATKAQFEANTHYIGASTSNLSLSYGDWQKLNIGFSGTYGFFAFDKVMLKANLAYSYTNTTHDIAIGAGARYYFVENGIFLGAGGEFAHDNKNINNLYVPVEVGYAFYLNRYITIEPSLYYRMSLNSFAKGSKVGLNVGLGFYF